MLTFTKDNYETLQINREADKNTLVQKFMAPITMQLFYAPIRVQG